MFSQVSVKKSKQVLVSKVHNLHPLGVKTLPKKRTNNINIWLERHSISFRTSISHEFHMRGPVSTGSSVGFSDLTSRSATASDS